MQFVQFDLEIKELAGESMKILYKKKILINVSATQLHELHNCKNVVAVRKKVCSSKSPNCINCILSMRESLFFFALRLRTAFGVVMQ